MENKYKEPEYSLPHMPVEKFDLKTTAIVMIDPQNDFLREDGTLWGAVGQNVVENKTREHLKQLFEAADQNGLKVFISPHYYYDHDLHWKFEAPGERAMHASKSFFRDEMIGDKGYLNSGADWYEEYKPFIKKDNVIVTSPHKIFGPQTNDLVLQLRKNKIDTVILSGMAANLCVESHLRDLIENGFEVVVVKDATAGPIIGEGDGYQAALVNYRIIANDLVETQEVIKRIQASH